jgi:hypothetical protein
MRRMLKYLFVVLLMVFMWFMQVTPAIAGQFNVGGNPMNIMGYISQGGQFNITDLDRYDSPKDFQSALTNVFLEGDYTMSDKNLRFYLAGMFTYDSAYDINSSNHDWKDKAFDKSRKQGLYMDNKDWQILKEAHVTWTPKNWLIRVGKQLVQWGETDGFLLMNQINPQDMRRGFADVEFETSLIPLYLLRFDYYVQKKPMWLQDLGLEFVFNPNVQFTRNQDILTGNDKGGIWAPYVDTPVPFPPGYAYIGSSDMRIDKPRAFTSDGFEYAFRVKGIINDAFWTLNGYYGRDKSPVTKIAGPPWISLTPDGVPLLHLPFEGKYPLFRFVGGTFSRDITPLKIDAIGGVAPVVRLEAFYAFDNTFTNARNEFEKKDELRYSIGVDWKAKIDFLNPRTMFNFSGQFYQRHIMDYPSGYKLNGLYENNNTTTLSINTSYFHNKLTPSLFWYRDWTNKAEFWKYQLQYDYTDEWRAYVGALFLSGDKPGQSFNVFRNKDYVYFKVAYKWK